MTPEQIARIKALAEVAVNAGGDYERHAASYNLVSALTPATVIALCEAAGEHATLLAERDRMRAALSDRPSDNLQAVGARSVRDSMGQSNFRQRAQSCWEAMARAALAEGAKP